MTQQRKIRAAMTETCDANSLGDIADVEAGQLESIRQTNVQRNIGLIHHAVQQEVHIICLAELSTAPYFAITREHNPMWHALAEDTESGPTVEELRKVTREKAIIVIAPIFELDRSTGMRYNTAVVLENGHVLGKCRKTHIPHGSNEQGVFTEGYYYSMSDDPGQNRGKQKVTTVNPFLPVFRTGIGDIGVNICYGRHFPENWACIKQAGAEMVFSPAVTFGAVSQRAWRHEFLVAAIWKGFFVGGSNRKGREFTDGPTYFGESHFASPDGRVLNTLVDESDLGRQLVIADMDLSEITQNKSGWKLEDHRRSDIAYPTS